MQSTKNERMYRGLLYISGVLFGVAGYMLTSPLDAPLRSLVGRTAGNAPDPWTETVVFMEGLPLWVYTLLFLAIYALECYLQRSQPRRSSEWLLVVLMVITGVSASLFAASFAKHYYITIPQLDIASTYGLIAAALVLAILAITNRKPQPVLSDT